MGNSDRASRIKAAASLAILKRHPLRVEERQVEFRQRTRTDYVASPDSPGTRNMIQRVVDTLDFLRTRGKLNERAYNAALRYRAAWDRLQSLVGGVMDFERARGGAVPGGMLGQAYLVAAGTLHEVRTAIGEDDFVIVHRVVGLNYSLQDVAGQLEQHRQTIATHLKRALDRLADHWELGKRWEGVERRRRVYAHRGFDARELRSSGEKFTPAKVAHADRRGVRYKG